MTVDGVFGDATKSTVGTLADALATKWDKPLSVITAWVRAKLTIALVRAVSACIRGTRSRHEWKHQTFNGLEDGAGLHQQFTATAFYRDSKDSARSPSVGANAASGSVEVATAHTQPLHGWVGGRIES
jgi:hypothetical protein